VGGSATARSLPAGAVVGGAGVGQSGARGRREVEEDEADGEDEGIR
jgi:hypothetical protein